MNLLSRGEHHLFESRIVLEPGPNWDLTTKSAADLRHEFVSSFGTTNRGILMERFGAEAQMGECRWVVKKTAEILTGLLNEAIRENTEDRVA